MRDGPALLGAPNIEFSDSVWVRCDDVKVTYPLPKGTVISSITLPAGELLRLDAPLRSGASYFLFTDPSEQYGFVRRTARTLVSAHSEPFGGREVVAVTFADGKHARKFELDEQVELPSIRALPDE